MNSNVAYVSNYENNNEGVPENSGGEKGVFAGDRKDEVFKEAVKKKIRE